MKSRTNIGFSEMKSNSKCTMYGVDTFVSSNEQHPTNCYTNQANSQQQINYQYQPANLSFGQQNQSKLGFGQQNQSNLVFGQQQLPHRVLVSNKL